MSADLFAEFNSLSGTPPPAQQPPRGGQSNQLQSHGWSRDPFGLGQSSDSPAPTSPPTQQWPSVQAWPSGTSGWASLSQPAQPSGVAQQAAAGDDDGWGDFEVADSTAPSTNVVPRPLAVKAQEPPPIDRITRVPAIDLMADNLVDVGRPAPSDTGSSWSQHQMKPKPRPHVQAAPGDPNVLFDADDFELQGGEEDDEDDDEFGDFEAVAQPPSRPRPAAASTANITPSLDLLSLDDSPPTPPQDAVRRQPLGKPSGPLAFGALTFGALSSNRTPAPKYPSLNDRDPFPDLSATTSAGSGPSSKARADLSVTAWPSNANAKDEDEDWAVWDDVPTADRSTKKAVGDGEQPDGRDWDAAGGSKPSTVEANDSDPPPMNVPPPSVILSAFPELFHSGNSLFKPVAGQNASIKRQILANPKAVRFLQGYLLLGATAARVIAGRKHRWHRDKILAKSMSISAAGSRGMKLAVVDKTRSAREDREAADVVAAWREHVGGLRSAVAAANSNGKASLKVPELSENMQIHTAKLVPTAPKPCIICGLKREERVARVDDDVEDSFGEWWAEHWGHRACKNFWVEHEQRLRQR
ncbi:Uncharacterized protein TCAP_04325 [Tolypocladium capitatum]|uniref:Serine/threonine-protein kinase ppk6 n=1 Tax=Tolypocladium capitatum TaxID=45235 RepID=A0A2K3QDY7_9HYPO|nr:Uncharacterized protein TCAP_04325 [Tolypocladium capitatum]